MSSKIKTSRITRRIGIWRFPAAELLGPLIQFIVLTPFLEDSPDAEAERILRELPAGLKTSGEILPAPSAS